MHNKSKSCCGEKWAYYQIKLQSLLLSEMHLKQARIKNRTKLHIFFFCRFKQIKPSASKLGRSGVAKVSCILRHQGVQLILNYSWARPAVLAAGMGRGGMFNFFCVFIFIHFPLSPLSLSFISTVSSISLLPFSGRRHKMAHKGWRVVKPQHNLQVNKTHTFFVAYVGHNTEQSKHWSDVLGEAQYRSP